MTLEETLKEMRKPFNERDLAGINEALTPEIYKSLTAHYAPRGVFFVGYGVEEGYGLGSVFDSENYLVFDCEAKGIQSIYYCRESFAREQGWLKKERKPWTLETLKERGFLFM